ncbi:MAG: Ig-like domain-containing protein [Clostridia bacterium]|nr:Ig-like domain-containing protein [Clostridia bacterium]
MKKKLIFLAAVMTLVAVLCSCSSENSISVKEKHVRMKKDESYTIKVKQTKEEDLTWSSNDESVVVVSPEGTVSAVGNGITTVTARGEKAYVHVGVIVDGNGDYTDKDGNLVRVRNEKSDITEIVVGVRAGGKNDVTLASGKSYQLIAYITPSDSKDAIEWECDKKDVVRVDKDGNLQVIGKGKAVVSAYAPNGVKGELIVRCK